MSNTQRPAAALPVVPGGDMGIGLCLQCLGEIIARGQQAPPPRFGITFAPMPFPAGNPVAFVAVPACWEHLQGAGAPPRKPLLVANGSLG